MCLLNYQRKFIQVRNYTLWSVLQDPCSETNSSVLWVSAGDLFTTLCTSSGQKIPSCPLHITVVPLLMSSKLLEKPKWTDLCCGIENWYLVRQYCVIPEWICDMDICMKCHTLHLRIANHVRYLYCPRGVRSHTGLTIYRLVQYLLLICQVYVC